MLENKKILTSPKQTNIKNILFLIKYLPSLFSIILSILIITFIYIQKQIDFKAEALKIKKDYIKNNKLMIKNEVRRVYKNILYEEQLIEEQLKMLSANKTDAKKFKENIKKKILAKIENIKYDKFGYIFVLGYDEKILSHYQKDYVDNNLIDYGRKDNKKITRDIINIAKEGEGYLVYKGTVSPNPSIKTSFIKGFDKWGLGYWYRLL